MPCDCYNHMANKFYTTERNFRVWRLEKNPQIRWGGNKKE